MRSTSPATSLASRRPSRTSLGQACHPLSEPRSFECLTVRISLPGPGWAPQPDVWDHPLPGPEHAAGSDQQARWLPSRLVPHGYCPRAELQSAHKLQVDMLR
jgi:hypothetical protein